MRSLAQQIDNIVYSSDYFKEYALRKDKVLEYKWLESEKVGLDIGFDLAWIRWGVLHYEGWKCFVDKERKKLDFFRVNN